jgi:TatD DNase family protein
VGWGTGGLAHGRAGADLPARRRGGARLSRRRAPQRLPGIVDSHAHLQHAAFDDDREEVLERAREAGLERILVPGWDLASSEAALALADRHPDLLHAAVGIHPHDVAGMTEADWARLEELASERGTRAIGEIGLDYHRNLSPPAVQREALARQLALAAEHGLPVLVHDREAHDDVTAALVAHPGRGLLHAFSGDAAMAEHLVATDFVISFALPVAFRSAVGPRGAAVAVDQGAFVVETDSPYLGPDRDRRNEPTTVLRVAAELARLRGTDPEALVDGIGAAYRSVMG